MPTSWAPVRGRLQGSVWLDLRLYLEDAHDLVELGGERTGERERRLRVGFERYLDHDRLAGGNLAAIECEVSQPLELTVLPYARMTTVRLRCERTVELRDRPFQMRQKILRGLTIETGRRVRDDGDVDLWAEVVRRPA